jgi:ADP-heptose:LPS heptosyltransferase
MDSANMHLGCLTSTSVISIWGPTHHYLGFGPLFNEKNIIQISHKKMKCRPCSVYGKIKSEDKECSLKSMEYISPNMVIKKIKDCL